MVPPPTEPARSLSLSYAVRRGNTSLLLCYLLDTKRMTLHFFPSFSLLPTTVFSRLKDDSRT